MFHEDLTVLHLCTLLIAIPLTILYKLMHGGKAPFSGVDADGLRARETGLLFGAKGGLLDSNRPLFREPPVWRSITGTLQRILLVQRAPTTLGDRQILTQTYAGGIPGPTLRVKAGDRIQLRLVNNMTLAVSVASGLADHAQPPPITHAHHAGPRMARRGPFASMLSAMTERALLSEESELTLLMNPHTHGLQVDARDNSDNPRS